MYAKRDMRVALNNILIFLRYQRRDGKFPGMISHRNEWLGVAAHYDWMQGVFLPYSALRMYYLIGKSEAYLRMLYESLSEFDAYLWRVRDSNDDGLLESWCKYDTGEDNAVRYGDAPNYATEETPPEGSSIVPMASMDVTSFSYAARDTLRDCIVTGIYAIALNFREKA